MLSFKLDADTKFEFSMQIMGDVEAPASPEILFIIKDADRRYGFQATHVGAGQYSVLIPAMQAMLKPGVHKCCVYVLIGDRFYVPHEQDVEFKLELKPVITGFKAAAVQKALAPVVTMPSVVPTITAVTATTGPVIPALGSQAVPVAGKPIPVTSPASPPVMPPMAVPAQPVEVEDEDEEENEEIIMVDKPKVIKGKIKEDIGPKDFLWTKIEPALEEDLKTNAKLLRLAKFFCKYLMDYSENPTKSLGRLIGGSRSAALDLAKEMMSRASAMEKYSDEDIAYVLYCVLAAANDGVEIEWVTEAIEVKKLDIPKKSDADMLKALLKKKRTS